jgi:GMP synthase (glutamine-hydrolysing)
VFEPVMRGRGWQLMQVELDAGEQLPEISEFDAVLVMGGPMGAYEDAAHPWLSAEKELLRTAVQGGAPVLGVCLGAQLLAASLGGRAYQGPAPEVGVLDVELTSAGRDDPVTGPLSATFPSLQWHSDTFDLPPGATLLARSQRYTNQAFKVDPLTYGIQFHLEVTDEMATEWGRVPAYAAALETMRGPGALDRLMDEFAASADTMQRLARGLFERWSALVERHAAGVHRESAA